MTKWDEGSLAGCVHHGLVCLTSWVHPQCEQTLWLKLIFSHLDHLSHHPHNALNLVHKFESNLAVIVEVGVYLSICFEVVPAWEGECPFSLLSFSLFTHTVLSCLLKPCELMLAQLSCLRLSALLFFLSHARQHIWIPRQRIKTEKIDDGHGVRDSSSRIFLSPIPPSRSFVSVLQGILAWVRRKDDRNVTLAMCYN